MCRLKEIDKKLKFETYVRLYGEAKEYTDIDMYVMERGWQEDWMRGLDDGIYYLLKSIYDISNNGIKAVLSRYKSLKQVSVLYKIPYSTVQKWKSEEITPPEYTVIMLSYITLFGDDKSEQAQK